MSRSTTYALAGVGALALMAGSFWLGIAVRGENQTVQTQPQTPQDELAHAALAFSMTAVASERTAELQAVKAVYEGTTSPLIRARAINVLLGFAHAAHEPYLYDALFNGEPFQKFEVPGDEQRSLANLADYSFSLYPTAFAAQIGGQIDSVELYALSSEPNTPDIEAQTQATVQDMRRRYDIANRTIGADLEAAASPLETAAILVGFFQWQGHLLGDISIIDPTTRAAALNNLTLGLSLAQDYDAQHHSHVFEEMIASMLYSRAKYAQLNGPSSAATVRADADALAAMLRAHPERHARFLILFKEFHEMQQGSAAMENMTHLGYMQQIAGRMREMALLSDSLKRLLAENGVTF